jgi:hypothetical protein
MRRNGLLETTIIDGRNDLFVTHVLHNAERQVDEQGTEALRGPSLLVE